MHSAFPRTFLKNDSRKQICKVKRLGKLSNNYFIPKFNFSLYWIKVGMYKKVISIVSSKVNLCKVKTRLRITGEAYELKIITCS